MPYVIAHAITPGSFAGLNLVQAAILVAKGLMAYVVASRIIPRRRALTFTTAVLFVVYPSDAGVLQLRSTPTHASVLCYLVTLYFLLLACDRLRWSAVIGFMAAQAVAIALYDSGIGLMLFTPVLILLIAEREI